MGRDKALLELDEETLVARAVRTLGGVCREVAIAGGDERLAGYGRVIPDERAGCGPLSGIVAALEQTQWEWNVFLAVDMPFVPGRVFEELAGAAEVGLAGVMAEGGWAGAAVVLGVRAELRRAAAGRTGCGTLASQGGSGSGGTGEICTTSEREVV